MKLHPIECPVCEQPVLEILAETEGEFTESEGGDCLTIWLGLTEESVAHVMAHVQ